MMELISIMIQVDDEGTAHVAYQFSGGLSSAQVGSACRFVASQADIEAREAEIQRRVAEALAKEADDEES